MGCLAEMTVAHPTSGSFGAWAEFYIGPLAGYLVRYAYWSCIVFAVVLARSHVDRYAQASPLELLPMKAPHILVHGTADDMAPFEISERVAKASGNASLIALPGADHHAPIDPNSKEEPVVLRNILSSIC